MQAEPQKVTIFDKFSWIVKTRNTRKIAPETFITRWLSEKCIQYSNARQKNSIWCNRFDLSRCSFCPVVQHIMHTTVLTSSFFQYISGVLSSADFITALGFQNGDEQGSNKDPPSFQLYITEDTSIIPKLHYGLKPQVKENAFEIT